MSHDATSPAHAHPTGATYLKVAVILTLITVIEVWAYYIPALVDSPWFNPALIIMSAAKFAIVVLFYMHLKYDHKLFKALFSGPLIIAGATIIALLFLFINTARPDDDRDGVPNASDSCPTTAPGSQVNKYGCAVTTASVERGAGL